MRKHLTSPYNCLLIAGVFLTIALLSALIILKQRQASTGQLICRDCNIVFVSFDTLRAANVHALGYARETTPTIDRFAQKAFLFTNAVSVAPWTLPSTMSWFTGVYPSQHKVFNKFTIQASGEEKITNLAEVSPGTRTLAEILRENGYRTGGFTGGAGVDQQFGFNQGFEMYTDEGDFKGFVDSVPRALEWIKSHRNEKLLVFLHGYDIHGQYAPPGGYDKRFVDFDYKGKLNGSTEEQKELREEGLMRGNIFLTSEDVRFLIALYDEKIQRADAEFGKFVETYTKLGLMDKTVFILTSDHGEEFYEHGRIDHGHSLYEEQLRVPLIISIPGMKEGEKIDLQVRSIDLMPTILDLVGVIPDQKLRQQMSGVSLIPVMAGKEVRLGVFPETDYRYAVFLRGIRTWDEWKFITNLESQAEELYDLTRDPAEMKSQTTENESQQLSKFRQLLQQHIEDMNNNKYATAAVY